MATDRGDIKDRIFKVKSHRRIGRCVLMEMHIMTTTEPPSHPSPPFHFCTPELLMGFVQANAEVCQVEVGRLFSSQSFGLRARA